MLVDTHTHLFVKEFDEDRDEVIRRAVNEGVSKMLLPNIDLQSIESMHQLAEAHPSHCYPMMGLHPSSVDGAYEQALDSMENLLRKRSYIGIGETGLDYYWDITFKKEQIKSLERHIEWAIELRLPIILHTRESFDDTYEVIRSANCSELRGIFHCFSGTEEDAMKVINLGGFKLGIGGVYTFKNSTLRESLKNISLEHIVLETDSPYLAPHPFRGKRNESAYLRGIAERMAEERNLSVKEIEKVTSRNAVSLFPQIQP